MKYALAALAEIDEALATPGRILIATDFDGTLCRISDSPECVRPCRSMIEILRQIAAATGQVTLAVISGRALDDVAERVPHDLVVAGNHGLEIRGDAGRFEHPMAVAARAELTAVCGDLVEMLRAWPGAWVEDKGLSATVHYRKVAPKHYRTLLQAIRGSVGRYGRRFALRSGNRAMEIRPKVNWEKGSALGYIEDHYGPFGAAICLGDDRTDETMFAANAGGINIRVGVTRPTRAGYYLWDSGEVAIFLAHVLDVCCLRATGGAPASAVLAAPV